MSGRRWIHVKIGALALLMANGGPLLAQTQEVLGEWIGGIPQFKIAAARAVPVLEIHELLRQPIETRQFRHEMPLGKFLKSLHEAIPGKGKQIGIVLDMDAFFEPRTESVDVRRADVVGPNVPRTMTVETLLRLVVTQLPVDAEVQVRRGYVWITTPERVSAAMDATVELRTCHGPLAQVLDDLAEDTGVNIVLDARVQKQAQRIVEANFVSPIRLGAALQMLTDMAELMCVLAGDTIYISSPRNARELERDQRTTTVPPDKLESRRVLPSVVEGSLAKVLHRLAEETSTNIVIDARVVKQCETGVKTKFVRSIPLRAAVEILADMAGLRCVDVDDALYVTSPDNARQLRKLRRRTR